MLQILFAFIAITMTGITAKAETLTFDLICGQQSISGTLDIDLNFSSWSKEVVVIDRSTRRPTWDLTSPVATLKIGTAQSQSARFFSNTGIGSRMAIESQTGRVSDFKDFFEGHFKEPGTFVLFANLKKSGLSGDQLVLLFQKGKPTALETYADGTILCGGRVANAAVK